jgi:hypothetical protein
MAEENVVSGVRFVQNLIPEGQRGGVNNYPFSGVLQGLKVTAPAIVSGNVTFSVNISAGEARLDGVKVALATNITALVLPSPTGVALNTGTHQADVYLIPQRSVRALTAAPSAPSAGDMYIKVKQYDTYQISEGIYEFKNNAWQLFDGVRAKPGYGHNNLPLNSIVPSISTATTSNVNFRTRNEDTVYHSRPEPLYNVAPSQAYLRMPAGIKLATVQFVNGTASILEPLQDRNYISL